MLALVHVKRERGRETWRLSDKSFSPFPRPKRARKNFMSKHTFLPVYKESYELLLHFYQISTNVAKEFKYTLGENIKNEIMEVLLNIYRANNSKNKKDLIVQAKENIEKIIILLRILNDLKQINLKKFAFLNKQIDSIEKQLSFWQKAN